MQSTPSHLAVEKIASTLKENKRIKDVHHVHVWQMDEKRVFLEGHFVIDEKDLSSIEEIKVEIRKILKDKFSVEHSTLEIECSTECRATNS